VTDVDVQLIRVFGDFGLSQTHFYHHLEKLLLLVKSRAGGGGCDLDLGFKIAAILI